MPYGTDYLLQCPSGIQGVSLLRNVSVVDFNNSTDMLNVRTADVSSIAQQSNVSAIFVADSATNISNGLDMLQSLLSKGSVSAITLTDSVTPSVTVNASQLTSDAGALQAISDPYNLAVTGVTAAEAASTCAEPMVGSIGVRDSAANVLTNLSAIQTLAAAGKLNGITLTDNGIPTLSITSAQAASDAAALNDISGNFSVAQSATGSNLTIAGASNVLGNTVIFSGMASQYTVTPSGDGVNFTVSTTGSTDHLGNIQALQFSDVTEIVAPTPGTGVTNTGGNITELYGAVFGRVPDVPGLKYYENELAANPSLSLTALAENFLSSSEYTANSAHNYAQTSAGDAQFITDSYNNLLHRAPESGAIPYYQKLISEFTQGLTSGTAAYTAAELQAHATMLVDFSASTEFLGDVQVTTAHPASAGFTGHWLLLI